VQQHAHPRAERDPARTPRIGALGAHVQGSHGQQEQQQQQRARARRTCCRPRRASGSKTPHQHEGSPAVVALRGARGAQRSDDGRLRSRASELHRGRAGGGGEAVRVGPPGGTPSGTPCVAERIVVRPASTNATADVLAALRRMQELRLRQRWSAHLTVHADRHGQLQLRRPRAPRCHQWH
jgi:hypothetical protein